MPADKVLYHEIIIIIIISAKIKVALSY